MGEFKFFLSSEISLPVRIKVDCCEGNAVVFKAKSSVLDPVPRLSQPEQVYVTCTLWAEGKPLHMPLTTGYHSIEAKNPWNEWLDFSVKYKDLPLSTQAVFTIWRAALSPDEASQSARIPIGGTTCSLFGKQRKLRKGRQRLIVWQGEEGDGSRVTRTPGKLRSLDEHVRAFDRLQKTRDRASVAPIAWLDSAVKTHMQQRALALEQELRMRDLLFLLVEFPPFEFPIIFKEEEHEVLAQQQRLQESSNNFVLLHDPELQIDINPVESKHRMIHYRRERKRGGEIGRDVQPNAAERKQITKIIKYSPTRQLTPEERDFLWNFRGYLKNDKKALTKFLKCVNWTDERDVQQVVQLLAQWDPVDVADALELLSSSHPLDLVRQYAVKRIAIADDEELHYYLLQLVQALRLEIDSPNPCLTDFLISRAVHSSKLSTFCYWYMTVECEDKKYAAYYEKRRQQLLTALDAAGDHRIRDSLLKQKAFCDSLSRVARELKAARSGRQGRLHELLGAPTMRDLFPVALPLQPSIILQEVLVDKASFFVSAMLPLRLSFSSSLGDYTVIYKNGDDLRQDQLVLQIFSLMDRLLKRENLDLKLTPYRVLATDTSNGLVEFAHGATLQKIERSNGSIKAYLEKVQSDGHGGIRPEVLDTFIKSCAGYCVFTYILGVGDRHSENLMLSEQGHLFHIDFGFILGNDPKPFAPPFKLSPDMVEAMGGNKSVNYEKFKTYCCEAYNILRKSANLIINLFSLMLNANLPQITGQKSLKIIEENFRLELTDEEAIRVFQHLIAESVNALFPLVDKQLHWMVSEWRNYYMKRN